MSYCTGCHTEVEEVGSLDLCGPCFERHEAFLWSCVSSADSMSETCFTAYVECALWASTDDDGENLDIYSASDIAAESLTEMRVEVEDFCTANAELIANLDPEQVGHDFWLTRNGHGAGFWDRGLGEIGTKLTDAAHAYGSSDLYIGDDGSIYVQ